MAKTTVKIEGLSELKDALRALSDTTAKNVMRRVLKRAGEPIAERMRAAVPKDTGRLRDSIMVSQQLSRRQKRFAKKEGPYDIEMFVGPRPLLYAHLQEFGTFAEPAQRYARPAWDAGHAKALQDITDDLAAEIAKTAARAARKAAKAKG